MVLVLKFYFKKLFLKIYKLYSAKEMIFLMITLDNYCT